MGGRVTEGMDSCVTLQPTAPGKKHNPQKKASDLRNCSSLAFVGKLQLTALREVVAPGNSLESCEQTEICSPGTREEPRCQSSLHPLPPCSQEQTSVYVCVYSLVVVSAGVGRQWKCAGACLWEHVGVTRCAGVGRAGN